MFAVVVIGADGSYRESAPMAWENAELVVNMLVNSGLATVDEVVVAALVP